MTTGAVAIPNRKHLADGARVRTESLWLSPGALSPLQPRLAL
jgi:hypothetical protein